MLRKGLKVVTALWLLAAVVGCGPAFAEVVALREERTVVGENQVVYPQLAGLDNAEIQQKINDDIVLRGDVTSSLLTLGTLREGGWGLKVGYDSFLGNGVLSVTLSAKGQMKNGREGQENTALCYDLATGEPIRAADLFTDLAGAVAYMEEKATATLLEQFSGYLENSELTPLPIDNFALDADGITFYYPGSQFKLISGYSGGCQFYYEELARFLNWDGVLGQMVKPQELPPAQAKAKIAEMVESGRLPHVPVKIGDKIPDIVEKYRLLREPDQFVGGKYYQMEAPVFRQVLVLSDSLEGGYDHSQVLGLQSFRADLFGIRAGETTREEWRAVLGQPDDTLVFDENLAYDYGIPQGESDFYTFGNYQLRLHMGQDGILHNIRVSK